MPGQPSTAAGQAQALAPAHITQAAPAGVMPPRVHLRARRLVQTMQVPTERYHALSSAPQCAGPLLHSSRQTLIHGHSLCGVAHASLAGPRYACHLLTMRWLPSDTSNNVGYYSHFCSFLLIAVVCPPHDMAPMPQRPTLNNLFAWAAQAPQDILHPLNAPASCLAPA